MEESPSSRARLSLVDNGDVRCHPKPEHLAQRIEQHLMGLQQISPDNEGRAMRQLGVCRLQLGPFAGDNCPILAAVELKGLAGREDKRHEGATAGCLLFAQPVRVPATDECRHPAIGTVPF